MPEAVAAVAQGRFRVWALRTVDEGLAALAGLPAGERRADGSFPVGSVHTCVAAPVPYGGAAGGVQQRTPAGSTGAPGSDRGDERPLGGRRRLRPRRDWGFS